MVIICNKNSSNPSLHIGWKECLNLTIQMVCFKKKPWNEKIKSLKCTTFKNASVVGSAEDKLTSRFM